MNSDHINIICNFLSAYELVEIKSALKRFAVGTHRERRAIGAGWNPISDGEVIPKGYDWMEVNGRKFTRKSEQRTEDTREPSAPAANPKKTDTSVSVVPELPCPSCGGSMYKEPVCPGCEDGKRGYKIRLLCGECDHTILL